MLVGTAKGCEISAHHAAQPTAPFDDVLVPAAPQVFRDFRELRPLAIPPRVPLKHEAAAFRARADVGEAWEVEWPRAP